MKNKKKFNLKRKGPILVGSAVIAAGLLGGGYYLYTQKLATADANTVTVTAPTTDAQVQQNVTTKSGAATDATTTPAVVAEKAVTVSLKDVSLSVFRNDATAEVSLYGPSGRYSVEKIIAGNWVNIETGFDYFGRGGRTIDTMESSSPETHYRISLLQDGKRVATSGDTVIVWQQLLNNGGTLSVPLAE